MAVTANMVISLDHAICASTNDKSATSKPLSQSPVSTLTSHRHGEMS